MRGTAAVKQIYRHAIAVERADIDIGRAGLCGIGLAAVCDPGIDQRADELIAAPGLES